MNIPRELIEQIIRGNVVLFVGNCLSVRAGLPGNADLCRQLAQRIGYQQEADLPRLAQYYANRNGRNALVRLLQDAVSAPNPTPTDEYKLLSELPVKTIFTTAYDDLLERAYLEYARRRIKLIIIGVDLPYWDETWVNIVKLHGRIDRPETLVITQRDYSRYFRTHAPVAQQLSALLATKTLLFVGYSTDDPAFTQLFEEIAHDLEQHQRRAFVVVENADPFHVEDLRQRNFTVIETQGEREPNLSGFLKQLLTDLASETKPSNLPPPPLNFVGREAETERLLSLVRVEREEPIVIDGPQGIGKTDLVRHFANLWHSKFKELALWVDCAAITEFPEANILHSLLRLLGLSHLDQEVDPEKLLTEVRAALAGRRALIVLDHIRHSESVRRITSLASLPHVDVVVTTREASVAGQLSSVSIQLAPLSRAEGVALVKRLAPALNESAHNTQIESLVVAVDGNPLYLEMMAKNIREKPGLERLRLEKLIEAITSRQTDLLVGDMVIPVAKPLAVAYEMLLPHEQRLFMLTGLLGPSDFSVDIMANLSSSTRDAIETGLERLVAASLLTRKANDRYYCPPLLKEFARELVMHSSEFDHLYSAYQAFCKGLADSLEGLPNEVVESHIGHIYAGLQWSLRHKDWVACRQYAEFPYRHVRVGGSVQLVHRTSWFLSELNASFAGSSLSDCDFSAARGLEANFVRAWINQINMSASDFRGAEFVKAQLSNVDFRGCDLRGVNFVEACLNRVDFSGADLRGANFVEARLSDVIFSETNLRGTEFEGARLHKTKLDLCDFRGVTFVNVIGVNVEVTNMIGTLKSSNSVWVDSLLAGGQFEEIFAPVQEEADALSEGDAKQEVQEIIRMLVREANKKTQASEAQVFQWLGLLAGLSPRLWEKVVATFTNPASGLDMTFQKAAERSRVERGEHP